MMKGDGSLPFKSSKSKPAHPMAARGYRPRSRRKPDHALRFEMLEQRCLMAVWNVPNQFTTLAAALASPQVMSGDTVEIAAGTYEGTNVELTKPVNLRGAGRGVTTLIGAPGAQKPVLAIRSVSGLTIEGLSIVGGTRAGVEVSNASPIIQDSEIRNNMRAGTGSAIYVQGASNAVFLNNIIHNNRHFTGIGYSGGYGAIWDASTGSTTYAWNEIHSNDSWNRGSVYLTKGTPLLRGNHIHSNVADYGGGVIVTGGAPTIENNLIVNNSWDYAANGAAGIYVGTGDAVIRFNTIANNKGDGILVEVAGTARIEGNIIASNDITGIYATTRVTLANNNVWGNRVNYAGSFAVADSGSRSFYPNFTTTFTPQAIEARDSGPVNANDLDGSRSDMGYTGGRGTSAQGAYRVETVIDESNVQYRMYKDGFHFNSLIWTGGTLPYRGCYKVEVCPNDYAKWALVNRSHVESDANGWGSSVYWNPYVRGSGSDSTTDAENGWVRDIVNTVNGVFVRAEGRVARGNQDGKFGTFETVRRIAYDAATKAMEGTGTLQIILQGSLAAAGLDLNVERIASNQMPDVPLWTGDRGTTGDIDHVKYAYGNGAPQTWLPVNTPIGSYGHYPNDVSAKLSIELTGTTNLVDTAAMGFDRIEPAKKPTVKTTIANRQGTPNLSFGGYYVSHPDPGEALRLRQAFELDNVATLALVNRSASSATRFVFDLTYSANAPVEKQFGWAQSDPKNASPNAGNDGGRGVGVDSAGNVYVGGSLFVDGDEGTTPGNADFFLAKYGSHGGRQWHHTFRGSGDERVKAVAVDATGNLFVVINSNSTDLDFDPGPGQRVLPTSGTYDTFLARFDTNGQLSWVVPIGGSSAVWDRGQDVLVSGNRVTVVGAFGGTVDFDRTSSYADNRDRRQSQNGTADAFVATYEASTGRFLWVWNGGGSTGADGATAVATDASGAVYAGIRFEENADLTSDGVADVAAKGMAVIKLDSTGRRVWHYVVTGTGWQAYDSLKVASDGSVLASGRFQSRIDFDARTDRTDIRVGASGSFDAFIQSLDANGGHRWVRTMGGTGLDMIVDTATTADGRALFVGAFQGTVDFDLANEWDGDRDVLVSGRKTDGSIATAGFVLVMDTTGNFLQATALAGNGDNELHAIAADSGGRSYVAGFFQGTATQFDGRRPRTLASSGGRDVFLAKYVASPAYTDVRIVSAEATGTDKVVVTYDIAGAAPAALDFGVYLSSDGRRDSSDSMLGGFLTVRDSVDLAPGRRTRTFTIGAGTGQIPLPGLGTPESSLDYKLLFVADPSNTLIEADADPLNWNNTVAMIGIYRTNSGSVFMHGGRLNDNVAVASNSSVAINGKSYSYAISEVRARLQGGADIFTAATTVTAPLSVFGGMGADTLTSGAGNDRLSGGLGDDTVVLDTDTQLGADIIDDAGGLDWLDFSGTTTMPIVIDIGSTLTQTVNANLRLTLMGAALIDAVAGGAGADTVRGNALANILLGNSGNDSLMGFSGNDLLIGGAGADSLSGGAGDDILIGGSTTYDSQRTALQTILAEWLGPETYDMKASRIRRGEASFPLLARSTVINDNSVDQLLGEDGQDWFWLSSGETLRDRLTTELIDTV